VNAPSRRAARYSGPWVAVVVRGQGAGGADRERHRRERAADHRPFRRRRRNRWGRSGDPRHHREVSGDLLDHRPRRRRTGHDHAEIYRNVQSGRGYSNRSPHRSQVQRGASEQDRPPRRSGRRRTSAVATATASSSSRQVPRFGAPDVMSAAPRTRHSGAGRLCRTPRGGKRNQRGGPSAGLAWTSRRSVRPRRPASTRRRNSAAADDAL